MAKVKLFSFVLILFLGACYFDESNPKQDVSLDALPATVLATPFTIQNMASQQATADIPMQFQEDCIEQYGANLTLDGILFLKRNEKLISDDFYQFSFGDQKLISLTDNENILLMPYSISPDGKSYFSYLNEGDDLYLRISAFDGTEISRFAWQPEWGQVIHTGWLAKDRVSVLVYSANDVPEYRVIVFNIASDNFQFIETNFPMGLNSLAPMIYYHPDLDKAIYVSGTSFILWDADRQSDVWQKHSINYAMLPSGWSPQGNWFGMSVLDEDQNAEIFMIDPTGKEFQLTNLAGIFAQGAKVYILNLQWSPNEHWIAFTYLLQHDVGNSYLANLAIIDIADLEMVDYCVKVLAGEALVWSPDGRYLAAATRKDGAVSPSTVILDIERGIAQPLLDDFLPIGWMHDDK